MRGKHPGPSRTPCSGDPELNKLFVALDESGRKLIDVARDTGVHDNTITSWRYGKRTPIFHNVQALANLLGYEFKLVRKDAEEE